MHRRRKILFLILSFVCFAGGAVSYLGMLMIGTFKASPGFPPEKAATNLKFYSTAFFVSIILGIVFAVGAFIFQKRKN